MDTLTHGPANREGPGMAPATAPAATAPAIREHHVRRIVEAARDSHAPATRAAYATAWTTFGEWCGREGLSPLPAAPETVAAFLAERAGDGLGASSLRMAATAIRHYHAEAGHPNPSAVEGVRRVLRGLTRQAVRDGRTAKQATGLTREHLAAIRATAKRPRPGRGGRMETGAYAERRGAVDVALVSVMRDALLRRSEAAALTWADVRFMPDRTARVTLRMSKADQDGKGAVLYVGREAAAALRKIQPVEAFALRVFSLRSGVQVSARIRKAANAASLEGEFSGHSPRVGMAVDLVTAGASVAAVQVAGRWVSARMPATYARSVTAGRGAVAAFYAEG